MGCKGATIKIEKCSEYLHIRCTKAEKSRIRWLADRYANGNLSLWVIRSALEMPRKKIKETELDLSRRYKKKKY